MSTTWKILTVLALGALVFALGRCSAAPAEEASAPAEAAADSAPSEPEIWTCPMHPQIRLPEQSGCPICGMDLVLLEPGGETDPRRLAMSPAAKELARIETAPVERRFVTRPVRMVGKVDVDETAEKTVSAWVPGRLDRLFVDYTGVRVAEGDHLVRLYSPELLTAQEELLGARARLEKTAGEASEFLADSNRRAYRAAREKLLLYGLTAAQVAGIEERGTAEDHVTIPSPVSGIVLEKKLDEGAYVKTGTEIYTIAALDRLWVRLDAYEQDLPWLAYGQGVRIEAEARPGEVFEGRIAFIDPVVHERTRTAKVRVNMENPRGRLKPGMFVRAVVAARLGAGGVVLDRNLAGKWVSPMHPEIVKDGPGTCDVCGMDLVPAEELGLVGAAGEDSERPLVVPASAVLVTGRRAVAYVEVPDAERPTYEGRVVLLGPRAGDEYVVLEGLTEGERVVVHGAFRIDSAMQIRAQPSMMSLPAEEPPVEGPEAELLRAALAPVLEAYVAAQVALAADDAAGARRAFDALGAAVTAARGGAARGAAEVAGMEAALAEVAEATELEPLRAAFEPLSRAVLALEGRVGNPLDVDLAVVHCPMAFDFAGADWLQAEGQVANPYFGAEMLRCGTVERVSPAR